MPRRTKKTMRKPHHINELIKNKQEGYLTGMLDQDISSLQAVLSNSFELVIRRVTTADGHRCVLFYFEQLVNTALLSEHLIKPLQAYAGPLNPVHIAEKIAALPRAEYGDSIDEVAGKLSYGTVVLLLERMNKAILFEATKFDRRSIERPETEDVIIGPHDGFNETLMSNLGLLRTRLHTPELKTKTVVIGQKSRTSVAIVYLENVAQEKLVNEVEERLKRIQIDVVYGASFLSDFIEDEPSSIFPTLRTTERPDRVMAALAEGRVIVIADGSPTALIAPSFLPEHIQSSEDYYEKPVVATFLRLLRVLSLSFAIFLPGTWIALTGFHHGILPEPLLASIVASRAPVPLPVVPEMFAMLVAFDIIIEASTRLPQQVGQAISIVGALVIGQSAVNANLVGAATVIVVALAGLSSYTLPSPTFLGSARLLKYVVLIFSSILGLYGTILSLIALIVQAASMRSFGYPSMFPLGPFNAKGFQEVFARVHMPRLWYRPRILAEQNTQRIDFDTPKPERRES